MPPIETLPVDTGRMLTSAAAARRPPGPPVAESRDGILPGAVRDLAYRLHRPGAAGPHPIVVYFHGGGWVLGDATSDDPFCRDICVQSGAMVISVDYRHAPEAPFPAAVEDAFAAVRWISEHAPELGGDADRIAVCGWSAGGNLAAVVCQLARDAGGPRISGQVLVNPVVDCDFSRESYREVGDRYLLTTSVMRWFWDQYTTPEQRSDPRAAPLRASSLSDLPPALVVTCELDPLRDEGAAYAAALARAGVQSRHLECRGQIHHGVPLVDVIYSARHARTEMGVELRRMLGPSRR